MFFEKKNATRKKNPSFTEENISWHQDTFLCAKRISVYFFNNLFLHRMLITYSTDETNPRSYTKTEIRPRCCYYLLCQFLNMTFSYYDRFPSALQQTPFLPKL